MNYAAFTVDDFVHDPYFRKWVKDPDQACRAFWSEFMHQYPQKISAVEEARELVLFLSFNIIQPSTEDQQEVKKSILRAIASESKSDRKTPDFTKRSETKVIEWKKYYTMAAAVAGILICAVAVFLINSLLQKTSFHTNYGETKTIQLPDGSSVILNANSSLRFSDNWKKTHLREVWLTGEAYFTVQKKPQWNNAEFIVHTDQVHVEVLGTTFNVNNRRGKVKVMLNTGKVKLKHAHNTQDSLTMQPRELVEIAKTKQTFIKKRVDPQEYISWRNHKLLFNETSLGEIAQVLEDNYGVSVQFEDASLANRRFTGSVSNQHISLFLTVLSQSMNIHITKEDNTIIIRNEE